MRYRRADLSKLGYDAISYTENSLGKQKFRKLDNKHTNTHTQTDKQTNKQASKQVRFSSRGFCINSLPTSRSMKTRHAIQIHRPAAKSNQFMQLHVSCSIEECSIQYDLKLGTDAKMELVKTESFACAAIALDPHRSMSFVAVILLLLRGF